VLRSFKAGDDVQSLVLSPSGRFVVTTGPGEPARVWDARTGRLLFKVGADWRKPDVPYGPDSLEFQSEAVSPNDRLIAFGCDGTVIQLYDPRTWRLIRQLRFPLGNSQKLLFSPDGRWLGSLCQNASKVIVWSTRTWRQVGQFTGVSFGMVDFCFSPESDRVWLLGFAEPMYSDLAVVSDYDIPSGLREPDVGTTPRNQNIVGVSGGFIAVSNSDGRVRVHYKIASLGHVNLSAPVAVLSDGAGRIVAIDNAPNSEVLATISLDQISAERASANQYPVTSVVRLWNSKKWIIIGKFDTGEHYAGTLSISRDGHMLATGATNGDVKVWRLK
jgi:WD40 repeat protein